MTSNRKIATRSSSFDRGSCPNCLESPEFGKFAWTGLQKGVLTANTVFSFRTHEQHEGVVEFVRGFLNYQRYCELHWFAISYEWEMESADGEASATALDTTEGAGT
jgi:hypothetical protein